MNWTAALQALKAAGLDVEVESDGPKIFLKVISKLGRLVFILIKDGAVRGSEVDALLREKKTKDFSQACRDAVLALPEEDVLEHALVHAAIESLDALPVGPDRSGGALWPHEREQPMMKKLFEGKSGSTKIDPEKLRQAQETRAATNKLLGLDCDFTFGTDQPATGPYKKYGGGTTLADAAMSACLGEDKGNA